MLIAIGLNVLIADLSTAGIRATRAAREVLDGVADDIEATAKTFVPVAEGALRDSIGVDRPDVMTRVIGPSLYYGRFVEDGTSKMAPQAYMGPALDRHSADLATRLVKVVGL